MKQTIAVALEVAGISVYIALLFCFFAFAKDVPSGPTVDVTGGEIRGSLLPESGAVFRGIPFAAPPVGNLRWRAPRPVTPWEGIRPAVQPAPPCIQPSLGWNARFAAAGREDCLYLDVWTPEWPAKASAGKPGKAVMVWIHGGANMGGAGGFDPLYEGYSLIKDDVVLVVIQYRLGVFGFLAHPELTQESPYHVSGNYAILDQIAALKWVHDNIARFGGDPENVTVFGQSAGSMDAMALMASPLSAGLFERVIGESGAIAPGSTNPLEKAEEIGTEFAARLNAPAKGAISYLRSLPAEKLKTANAAAVIALTTGGWVFPQSPTGVFVAGKEQRLPLLIGTNAVEFPVTGNPAELRKRFQSDFPDIASRALTLYGLDKPGSQMNDPVYGSVNDQIGSDEFRCAVVMEGVRHSTAGNPTWEYQFDRPIPPHSHTAHSGELAYIFGNLRSTGSQAGKFDETDHKISAIMQKYWTNFAKYGNPNGSGLPNWPEFEPRTRTYIEFAEDGSVMLRHNQRGAFCALYEEHWRHLSQYSFR